MNKDRSIRLAGSSADSSPRRLANARRQPTNFPDEAKDKERLLSFEEPVRFIFSHSALREGWDNPNVFVICTLKHSDNTISRRQEVGRGLRLSVNQDGDRMDDPATVHQINVLTVVASESYKDFVAALQKDISASLSARPRKADEAYFTGKVLKTESGDVSVTPQMARLIENTSPGPATPTTTTRLLIPISRLKRPAHWQPFRRNSLRTPSRSSNSSTPSSPKARYLAPTMNAKSNQKIG
jgi:superfamily II DNA or RNA helicase